MFTALAPLPHSGSPRPPPVFVTVVGCVGCSSFALTFLPRASCPPPLAPRSLRCGHTYCSLCLRRWLLIRPECPACRRPASAAHFVVNAVAHGVVGALWRYRQLPAPPPVVIPPCVPDGGGGGGSDTAADARARDRPAHLPFLPAGLTSVATFRTALAAAGLPTTGDRSALAARHAEYVVRYNAAVDAPAAVRPGAADLARQVRSWEAATGGAAAAARGTSGSLDAFLAPRPRAGGAAAAAPGGGSGRGGMGGVVPPGASSFPALVAAARAAAARHKRPRAAAGLSLSPPPPPPPSAGVPAGAPPAGAAADAAGGARTLTPEEAERVRRNHEAARERRRASIRRRAVAAAEAEGGGGGVPGGEAGGATPTGPAG